MAVTRGSVNISIRIRGQDESTKAFASATQRMGKLEKKARSLVPHIQAAFGDDMAKKFDRFTHLAGSAGSALMGVKVAIGSVVDVARAMAGVAKEGAASADQFEILSAEVANFSGIVERAKRATTGMLSEAEITKSAAMFRAFGMDVEKLPEVLEATSKAAIRTGQSAEHMAQSLSIGVARGSAKIIDNLGVVIKLAEVNERAAIAQGKTVDKLTETEKRAALLTEVLERLRVANEPVNLLNSRAAALQRVAAGYEDVKNAAGGALATLARDAMGGGAAGDRPKTLVERVLGTVDGKPDEAAQGAIRDLRGVVSSVGAELEALDRGMMERRIDLRDLADETLRILKETHPHRMAGSVFAEGELSASERALEVEVRREVLARASARVKAHIAEREREILRGAEKVLDRDEARMRATSQLNRLRGEAREMMRAEAALVDSITAKETRRRIEQGSRLAGLREELFTLRSTLSALEGVDFLEQVRAENRSKIAEAESELAKVRKELSNPGAMADHWRKREADQLAKINSLTREAIDLSRAAAKQRKTDARAADARAARRALAEEMATRRRELEGQSLAARRALELMRESSDIARSRLMFEHGIADARSEHVRLAAVDGDEATRLLVARGRILTLERERRDIEIDREKHRERAAAVDARLGARARSFALSGMVGDPEAEHQERLYAINQELLAEMVTAEEAALQRRESLALREAALAQRRADTFATSLSTVSDAAALAADSNDESLRAMGRMVQAMEAQSGELAKGGASAVSASGAVLAAITQDIRAQAAIRGAFEVAASAASFAAYDYAGGAAHAVAAGLYFGVAGHGGGSSSRGSRGVPGSGPGAAEAEPIRRADASDQARSVNVYVSGFVAGTSAEVGAWVSGLVDSASGSGMQSSGAI